ncbi:hypothetical protein ABZ619_43825 [Streptomyces sp. NPDC007851]|uniref:hypothetical protein n=1 Tax=Streptomyces sp. NPDC007851 TaxID=3155008 RepID=UPI0034040A19
MTSNCYAAGSMAPAAAPGLQPGRSRAELVGGPLDGLLLGITGRTPDGLGT